MNMTEFHRYKGLSISQMQKIKKANIPTMKKAISNLGTGERYRGPPLDMAF